MVTGTNTPLSFRHQHRAQRAIPVLSSSLTTTLTSSCLLFPSLTEALAQSLDYGNDNYKFTVFSP